MGSKLRWAPLTKILDSPLKPDAEWTSEAESELSQGGLPRDEHLVTCMWQMMGEYGR